jgi:hypothetical protein
MRIDVSRIERRLALLGLGAFGIVHVLVPEFLLRSARSAYGLALDVEFTPRENAARRVRLVGLLSLIAAAGWSAFDGSAEPRGKPTIDPPSEPASRDSSAENR